MARPPTITSQPVADQNATIGSNVTFSVDANGTGLTYQWQKQDANGTWVNIGGATASSYAINSVQAIHAGAYRVAITNASGGTAHSSSSVLNVSTPIQPLS